MGNEVRIKEDGIEFGDGYSLVRAGDSLQFRRRGTVLFQMNATGVGLLGAAPVAQAAAYTQTFSTADKTHAAPTATSVATTALVDAVTGNFAYDTAAQGDAVATTINQIIVDVADVKALVNSVIDDLQALGLVG